MGVRYAVPFTLKCVYKGMLNRNAPEADEEAAILRLGFNPQGWNTSLQASRNRVGGAEKEKFSYEQKHSSMAPSESLPKKEDQKGPRQW